MIVKLETVGETIDFPDGLESYPSMSSTSYLDAPNRFWEKGNPESPYTEGNESSNRRISSLSTA